MKKETIKTIITTICTILSAIAAAITTNSCCKHITTENKAVHTKCPNTPLHGMPNESVVATSQSQLATFVIK